MIKPLQQLAQSLVVEFCRPELLQQALTHRSADNTNNERLEFLGDAILGMIIAERLYRLFPDASEGQLSRLRAMLVKRETLAEIGRELALNDYLVMGSGELRAGGQTRNSTLADAVEAILGALYLDQGIAGVTRLIDDLYTTRLNNLNLEQCQKDPKTRLQEYLQSRSLPLPDYKVERTEGKQHQQTFYVSCSISTSPARLSNGKGGSRRTAEQSAAQSMLDILESNGVVNE